MNCIPDSKVHGANMGPIWGREDPGGPHVGPMNLALWDCHYLYYSLTKLLTCWGLNKNHCYFPYAILKCIFFNRKDIPVIISQTFLPNNLIDNKPEWGEMVAVCSEIKQLVVALFCPSVCGTFHSRLVCVIKVRIICRVNSKLSASLPPYHVYIHYWSPGCSGYRLLLWNRQHWFPVGPSHIYMDLDVWCSRRAIKLNHSLTHRLSHLSNCI